MENFTVKDLGVAEQKSIQEVENELLQKHEEKMNGTQNNEEVVNEQVVEQVVEQDRGSTELKDEDVLSYIKNRYNKEVNSLEDLFEQRSNTEDLPEDVSAFLKYKKETGRGIDDFIRLNKVYDESNPESILAEYYAQTEEDLDQDDIMYMIEDKFGYDADLDDERDVKKKEMAKKKELGKAKKYLDSLKEQYRTPLESRGGLVPDGEKEGYEAYKKYVQEASASQQEGQKKSEYFQKKTEEVFNKEFKGFEFNLGDKSITFAPGDANELKSTQSNLDNFISRYIGEDGLIKDAAGWHRSLSAAMNPEKMAKFFYEQGKSDALKDSDMKMKNIDMQTRNSPQAYVNNDFQIKAISSESSSGLKIRSIKNN
jgi:hypothetical protein